MTGTVTDDVTGLSWQQVVEQQSYTWQQAATYCAGLVPMGYWRLPTRIELTSIVDYTKSNPAIDAAIFLNTPTEPFWSASTYAKTPNFKWLVSFLDGLSYGDDIFTSASVRCVH